MSDLKFTRTHEWLKVEGNQVIMGITDHAQQLLGDMVFVDFPEAGREVNLGDELGVVESVKAASDFYAPIGGTVIAVNAKIADNPALVNTDPYGEGWLVKMTMKNPEELNSLLSEAQYQETMLRIIKMPYIPHSDDEIQSMLSAIGAKKTADLFDEIPQELRHDTIHSIPSGINEMTMLKEASNLATANKNLICFMGAGSYQHHIPAAVWHIASRGEFLTAYTPYQAEASQGTLQLLYEYQTMISELTGMDVANASMYDGATAVAEAVLMAIRCNKKSHSNRILVAGTLHPFYRETLETIVRNQHIELLTLPFNPETGITALAQVESFSGEDIAALVIAQPNFFGCLEQVDALTDWAFENHVKSIAVVNPVALALLKPPGSWGKKGVDIVCGEGQPLGVPMASGGPYFGFLATRMVDVRQLPGRLIGRTHDKEGKEGFSLTLQAREQHIRRGKATSNICTNQGLLVTAATIHMALLGAVGLAQVAKACHQNTLQLVKKLTAIKGVEQVFSTPFFHECLLTFNKPVEKVLQALETAGIAGGYPVSMHYQGLEDALLVCATEMRTPEEIDLYVQTIQNLASTEA